MALQNKIESKLEKSLGPHLNIQLQKQMGVFQASMLEAMQSLREEFKTMKKASEMGVDQIPASNAKPGTSKHNDDFPSNPSRNLNIQQPNIQSSNHPSLPPQFRPSVQSEHGSDPNGSDHTSKQSEQPEWEKCQDSLKSTFLRRLKAKFRRMPIFKKQQGMAMKMPVTSLRF